MLFTELFINIARYVKVRPFLIKKTIIINKSILHYHTNKANIEKRLLKRARKKALKIYKRKIAIAFYRAKISAENKKKQEIRARNEQLSFQKALVWAYENS